MLLKKDTNDMGSPRCVLPITIKGRFHERAFRTNLAVSQDKTKN